MSWHNLNECALMNHNEMFERPYHFEERPDRENEQSLMLQSLLVESSSEVEEARSSLRVEFQETSKWTLPFSQRNTVINESQCWRPDILWQTRPQGSIRERPRVFILSDEIVIPFFSCSEQLSSDLHQSVILAHFKSVERITQIRQFLHVEVTHINEGSDQFDPSLESISSHLHQWCESTESKRNSEISRKFVDDLFDNSSVFSMNDNELDQDLTQSHNYVSSFHARNLTNSYTNSTTNYQIEPIEVTIPTLSVCSQCSSLLSRIDQHMKESAERQLHFQIAHNGEIAAQYNLKNSSSRFDTSRKRSTAILKKLSQDTSTSMFTYKLIRKTPMQGQTTVAWGMSTSLIERYELNKRDLETFILRNNNFPWRDVDPDNTTTQILNSINSSLDDSKNSLLQDNRKTKVLKILGRSEFFKAEVYSKVFIVNEQLGDNVVDINDYLVVEVFENIEILGGHSEGLSQKPSLASESLHSKASQSSSVEYLKASKRIVKRYYKKYSEDERYAIQLQRLLNKRNHKFR